MNNEITAMEHAKEIILAAEAEANDVYARIENTEHINQERVLNAFQNNNVSARHFTPSYGYGYDDISRDKLDSVFAEVFGAEDALVRPQIVSGTHALFLALSGILKPGETLLSVTGKPYDTLEKAIGIGTNEFGSLLSYGINYKAVELTSEFKIDLASLQSELDSDNTVKVVYIQRSRGYAWRDSINSEQIKDVCRITHAKKNCIVMLDNCYGEFTDSCEPTSYGVDIAAGSLIKNPGGGIAPTGGYICGKHELIEQTANKLTVPGMGREVGSYADSYQPFYQGLFMAPHVTANALKTSVLFARAFEIMGMETLPAFDAQRNDIVQSIRFKDAESLIAFCKTIQAASPIDSNVVPEPWDMPGYSNQVIMAAGSFVQGSSIELSADAPICEPYTAYIQGSLTYSHGRIAATRAIAALLNNA